MHPIIISTLNILFITLLVMTPRSTYLIAESNDESENTPLSTEDIRALVVASDNSVDTIPLTTGDIRAISIPTVVRVITKITGDARIPVYSVDTKKLSLVKSKSGSLETLPLDEYISGLGFIVSPNGHIITNTSNVSITAVKQSIASLLAPSLLLEKTEGMSLAQKEAFDKTFPPEAQQQFLSNAVRELIASINIEATLETVVLPLYEKGADEKINDTERALEDESETLAKLMSSGTPVAIVESNPIYLDDGKDVALIKVLASKLPFAVINPLPATKVNDSITAFTSTGVSIIGTVQKIVNLPAEEVANLETDVRIPDGSNGGPVIDKNGKVIGIVGRNNAYSENQENMVVLPITIASDIITRADFTIPTQGFQYSMIEGIALAREKHCQNALIAFQSAREFDETFSDITSVVSPYEKGCNDLMELSQSIDTSWDEFLNKMLSYSITFWIIVAISLVVFIIILTIISKIMRRRRIERLIAIKPEGITITETTTAQPQTASNKSSAPAPRPNQNIPIRSEKNPTNKTFGGNEILNRQTEQQTSSHINQSLKPQFPAEPKRINISQPSPIILKPTMPIINSIKPVINPVVTQQTTQPQPIPHTHSPRPGIDQKIVENVVSISPIDTKPTPQISTPINMGPTETKLESVIKIAGPITSTSIIDSPFKDLLLPEELSTYVHDTVKNGFDTNTVKTALLKAGWDQELVTRALHNYEQKK